MLVEIMMICALTDVEPYYDCNAPKWALIAYDNYNLNGLGLDDMCNTKTDRNIFGCASYNKNTSLDGLFTPIIVLSGTNYIDEFGMSTLQHEIKHIKCRCAWEGHING